MTFIVLQVPIGAEKRLAPANILLMVVAAAVFHREMSARKSEAPSFARWTPSITQETTMTGWVPPMGESSQKSPAKFVLNPHCPVKGHAGAVEHLAFGRDGLLAAIRGGGGGLKKAGERAMPEKVVPARNALLDEITRGKALKKVIISEAPKAAEQPMTLGGLSVAAILARRAALQGDEDDDSDDDDEWDD